MVYTSKYLIDSVSKEIQKQMNVLTRAEIAVKSIENSRAILVKNNQEALDLINVYGPENFIVLHK